MNLLLVAMCIIQSLRLRSCDDPSAFKEIENNQGIDGTQKMHIWGIRKLYSSSGVLLSSGSKCFKVIRSSKEIVLILGLYTFGCQLFLKSD